MVASRDTIKNLGGTTTLGRPLSTGKVLPNLSPLSDRNKLAPTPETDDIAYGMERSGYDVGWENGFFQVQPSPTSPLSPTQDISSSYQILNGTPKTGPRCRTPSILSFKSKPASAGALQRPRTSGSISSPGQLAALKQSSGRFSRLASSMDGPNILRLHHTDPASYKLLSRSLPHALSSLSDAGHACERCATPQVEHPDESAKPSLTVSGLMRPGTSASLRPQTAGELTPQQRAKLSHPARNFKASRGHALLVFNEVDKDKNGKVTRAEFEEAAVSLGFQLSQAEKMFNRLDTKQHGYLDPTDWGRKEGGSQMEAFATMYMQKYMGLPDITCTPEQVRKYWQQQELRQVKSLPAAINLVRVNALTKGAHAATRSGHAIFDTFRFIDVDGSGDLSKEELRDAFFALGVYLSDKVTDQIMTVFDSDGNGTVNYHEFVKTMFPASSRNA